MHHGMGSLVLSWQHVEGWSQSRRNLSRDHGVLEDLQETDLGLAFLLHLTPMPQLS